VRFERRDGDLHPIGQRQGAEETVELRLAVGPVQAHGLPLLLCGGWIPEPHEMPLVGQVGSGDAGLCRTPGENGRGERVTRCPAPMRSPTKCPRLTIDPQVPRPSPVIRDDLLDLPQRMTVDLAEPGRAVGSSLSV
jgi:hypothetical protein